MVEKKGKPNEPVVKVKDERRIKFFAGVARAAFNTDAIVVDNAVPNGIEKYAMRRGVVLIGVAPED